MASLNSFDLHLHVHQLAELFTIVDLSTCHQKEPFLTILIGHQHKVAYSWNLFNISRVVIILRNGLDWFCDIILRNRPYTYAVLGNFDTSGIMKLPRKQEMQSIVFQTSTSPLPVSEIAAILSQMRCPICHYVLILFTAL